MLLLVSGGGRGDWPPEHWMRWSDKGAVNMKRRGPTARIRIRKGRNQSRSAAGAYRQTARDPPGIELPGVVRQPHIPDPWHMWGSWRGEPQYGWRRGSRSMWGRRPSPRSGGKADPTLSRHDMNRPFSLPYEITDPSFAHRGIHVTSHTE